MLAFIKRRWILLSCAAVLLACSIYEGVFSIRSDDPIVYQFGVLTGELCYQSHDPGYEPEPGLGLEPPVDDGWYIPNYGGLPKYVRMSQPIPGQWKYTSLRIPIWLPLAAVLGWLVIRELRWHEKRAKESSASRPPN